MRREPSTAERVHLALKLVVCALVLATTAVVFRADVRVHVIDTGGALCTLSDLGAGHWMVFDAGVGLALENPKLCAKRIHDLMPHGETIDLLVLSHSDADHISSVPELLRRRGVEHVVRTGHARDTRSWCATDYWIKVRVDDAQAYSRRDREDRLSECRENGEPVWVRYDGDWPPPRGTDFNLLYYEIEPGEEVLRIGQGADQVKVSLFHGLNRSPSAWDSDFPFDAVRSRRRNSISIVAKLEYAGKSVLFTGDSVGHRGNGDVDGPCIATERSLVASDRDGDIELDSDVLIAPHHGSSNGSCLQFIESVDPEWVVFTAGHAHKHPTYRAIQRYIRAGIPEERLLRTDRGDREDGGEWRDSSTPPRYCIDPGGDDDVLIDLRGSSGVDVRYAKQHRQRRRCR